ncbi:MAG TPA: hypothetical protein PKM41_00675 [Deltaproteobacteria bacterium]|nr:hypothetical protein [Deltaproteobacteria bacterium]HOI05942.1 hypothetical protein [Deltaproteobacteria bacterium]
MAIYFENKPSVYARIEMITADIKPHWYQVRLLFLSFPPQETTWILREEYLDGADFTMKDIPIRIVPLAGPGGEAPPARGLPPRKSGPGDLLSLDRFRKKKQDDDP